MGATREKLAKHPLPVPAFWAALAFAAGIFASALATNHLLFWFVLSALSGLCAAIFHLRSHNSGANFSIFFLLAGLGGLRYSAATDIVAGRSVANFAGLNKRMVISGRVCELPDIKPDRIRIYLDKVEVGWKQKIELEGKVLLSISRPVSGFALEDRIEFVGFLDSLWHPANPGELDFAHHMRIRGVEGTVFLKDAKGVSIAARSFGGWRRHLSHAREQLERKLTDGLPPKAAGVIKGFVLGDTKDIEPSTYELFRKTGTLHLLAVSGANVAWVALLPILLLKIFYLSLRWRYVVALALVWVFVLLTDLQASVLRAAIMFTFWTVSKIVYRDISGMQSLGLSALFLLCVNPLWFFDIGFELSYLAAFALIFFSYKEFDSFDLPPLKSKLLSLMTTSLVAFLATFPLIAFYFNQVTPVSLLSNLFAVPLAMLITWSAFLFGFLNLLGIGPLLTGGLVFLFDSLFRIQELFTGRTLFHFVIPHPDGWTTSLLFLTVFALLVFVFKSEWRKAGAYLLLSGLIPLVWLPALKGQPKFSLSVLEARGEVVSVLSMADRTVVVGGGEVRETKHTPRQVLEPFLTYLGNDGIDAYLPLRFDSSGRAASAEIAKSFRPGFVGWPMDGSQKGGVAGSMDIKFEYLLTTGDSAPFALRLIKGDFTFLFIPQIRKVGSSQWDSLLAGQTVPVAPLEMAQAESLARSSNVKAVVSIRRDYRLPETFSGNVFFTFRDGAVTFQTKKEGLAVQTHLSGRKVAFANQ